MQLYNDENQLPHKALFLAISKGSQEAFRQFFYIYEKRIYGFLYKMLRSHEEVEELLQVVFVKIWENRTAIDPDLSPDAYVFQIAKNCALDVLRQKARRLLLEKQLLNISKGDEKDEIPLIHEDLKKYVDSLLANIPQRRREIFKLRYEQELSYKEIAKQLSISENTVDTQIRRTLNYLRERLGKELWAVTLPLITFFSILEI
ncbi:MAG: RNA polymerase sigma-70 factor [Bacteroidales bacterium]|nr:RNA polymerase sigma-70 factor [Bacteroidales bacterium]